MGNKRPNMVLFITDQHRYDCVGYSGKYPVKTPNMDELAQKSVWFEQAYSTIPTCCPARQSLICGQRPERFGAHWNYDITLPVPALAPDAFSFARALKESGYQTAYIGKWHVNPDYTPLSYGFDSYYGLEHYHQWLKEQGYEEPWKQVKEEGTRAMLGQNSDVPYEVATPHHLAARGIEKIKEFEEQEEPFLVVISVPEPHLPCTPSAPFSQMFQKEDVEKWGGFDDTFEEKPYIQKQMTQNWMLENLTWEDWSACVARYYACIAQVDDALGMVVHYLEEKNRMEDTVVVYTSDHGDMCGSHRMLDKHYIMYDDVVHVPFMMRWDGHFMPGVCHDFVHNFLDLHTTILELARARQNEISDGKSLLNQLHGKEEGREYAVSTYNGQQFGLYNQRMIRTKRYKYIWNLTDVDELYDLEQDPYELKNRIHDGAYEDILKQLRHLLYEELERCGDRLLKGTGAVVQLLYGNKL